MNVSIGYFVMTILTARYFWFNQRNMFTKPTEAFLIGCVWPIVMFVVLVDQILRIFGRLCEKLITYKIRKVDKTP
jgi:hypothetical protein